VYAPRKPIVTVERSAGETSNRSVMRVKTSPRTEAPVPLTTSVPHGKLDGKRRPTAPSSP
jgi:hypothetical protein